MANSHSTAKEKALVLLGQGLATSVVASALGVTDSAVSQYLADPEFAVQVQKLRFENLTQASELDGTYNELEGKLLKKLERAVPMLTKPGEILKAISVVNGAKRRGVASVDPNSIAAKVVQITIPSVLHQTYVTNVNNQVIEVQDGEGNARTLVTIDSASLEQAAIERKASKALGVSSDAGVVPERSGEGGDSEAEFAGETEGSYLASTL